MLQLRKMSNAPFTIQPIDATHGCKKLQLTYFLNPPPIVPLVWLHPRKAEGHGSMVQSIAVRRYCERVS
jgi:hypothetical protein